MMENDENVEESMIPLSNQDSQRYCWVCFATDEDDRTAMWVQPCLCRGSSKWVNEEFLF